MYAEPLIALLTFIASLGFVYGHRLLPTRLEHAAAIVDKFVGPTGMPIRSEQIRRADCVAIIPGFKTAGKDAHVFGGGFITCHNGDHWSAPAAVTLQSSNPNLRVGAEKIDLVMLSMNHCDRQKLLSGQFTIGGEISAAWGHRADSDSQILFFGRTKSALAEFSLDGITLKPDESSNKALYGRPMSSAEVIDGSFEPPKKALAFIKRLTASFS